VPGFNSEKTMEVRFFAPGNLVSNLDFVESIFGNAGDPHHPENDAALDSEHWTGHTGCVILAPHLVTVRKKDVGLPPFDQATERQRRDGMCWKKEDELYNNGGAFKITCRDARGVIVTIIADNYFGYCKKEVKTQLSYSANLFGIAEEEHSGGALVFPSYDLGEEFSGFLHVRRLQHSYAEMISLYGEVMDVKPEGYAIDRNYPNIYYVPENVEFDLQKQRVSWKSEGVERSIKMLANVTYVRPSGYKVNMEKPDGGRAWRLVGTVAEATVCHKPCTVSGGGKSEISKPISDAIIQGPTFVADFQKDFDEVERIIQRDYADRFHDTSERKADSRAILSQKRSLGSVIKLLTPSPEYTDAYNAWLESTPQYIKELVFVVKRFYKPEWGANWREHFSVDIINGLPGNELKCDRRKLVSNYLRVGYADDGSWRTFGLRKDFHPAAKIALEDDITASVTVPRRVMFKDAGADVSSIKFVKNCEYRLFQRPDDAIHRGYDKQTERDFARDGNFFSNYEPLPAVRAAEMIEDAITFDQFTEPMEDLITAVAREQKPSYFVSNAHPRLVNGKPTKNPRYLQIRPDLIAPRESYLGEMSARLFRRLPLDQPVYTPVTAVLPGRRNNPPEADAGIRALAVYNPIHFMEPPELFMEYICSMTGKSPSTTGAGSEGALTKGPFNALPPIYDLNNALVAYLITGHEAFITAAGYVGPKRRVDHDVSLLVPEVWSRMSPAERDPHAMIRDRFLEKCEDFHHNGKLVQHSRIGYRITQRFVNTYFGRIFNHPHIVFTEEMLKPELQDLEIFVDGMDNVVLTQQRVAQHYFNDGSIELACPPLKALLHIMRDNHYNGKGLEDPSIRELFTRRSLLASGWYRQRLEHKQKIDIQLWERHMRALEHYLNHHAHDEELSRLHLEDRLDDARLKLRQVRAPEYLQHLQGTIGAQPL
jgi:phosphoenolpyruvate carboxykinase (diphosphate)